MTRPKRKMDRLPRKRFKVPAAIGTRLFLSHKGEWISVAILRQKGQDFLVVDMPRSVGVKG